MRVFSCGHCGQAVYFDNVVCENCNNALGFDPDLLRMLTLYPDGAGRLVTRTSRDGSRVYCANYDHQVCNWLVPEEREGSLCLSCGLNRTIPDLTVPSNVERWFVFEKAKRWLIYGLRRLGLPVDTAGVYDGGTPLAFDIVADAKTGHDSGLITLNLAEADPSVREQVREDMDEPYRTLLGHVRHESGHYYWQSLICDSPWLTRFRELFGDERADYQQALATYHQNRPPADWARNYISAYATAHPWEDWAESWAHYLHMVEALETACDYRIEPRLPKSKLRPSLFSMSFSDPYRASGAKALIDKWVPLALAMNSLNRSMGLSDFYPFVVSPTASEKLEFIHSVINTVRAGRRQALHRA